MTKPLLIDDVMPTVAARMRADALEGTVPVPAYQASALAAIREIIRAGSPRGNPTRKVDLILAVIAEVDRLDATFSRPDPGE
jgi:hypothetical protein